VIRKVGTNGMATIIAGNGSASYSGDGGAATNAALWSPASVAIDAIGNLFVADSGNSCIRKISTNGIITTVAGNGQAGYSGDGGAATNAKMFWPAGLAVDTNGVIFIADTYNHRIRRVPTNGMISSVAGTGTAGYTSDGGSAVGSQLNYPNGVAVDASGNIFIADTSNNRIRKVNTAGTISTVVNTAGTAGYSGDGGTAASAKINSPCGITVDSAGNLLVVDAANNRIRKVGAGNIITTIAGNGTNGNSGDGGAATNANLSYPQNVAVDKIGNLLVTDFANNEIRKVQTNGIIATVSGRSPIEGDAATNAMLNYSENICFDSSGNLFIADSYNNRIRKVNTNGFITTVAGNGLTGYSGDGGAATNASLYRPAGVASDNSGNLLIADSRNLRVRRMDTNGVINTVAGNGLFGNTGDGGSATNAKIGLVYSITVDNTGNVFLVDNSFNRIRKVDTNGIITTVASASMTGPYALALDANGNIFVANSALNDVIKVFTNGSIQVFAGQAGFGTGGFSGDGGFATNAQLRAPQGLAFDKNGSLIILDTSSHRIRKVDTNNIVTTIAGTGTSGNIGDGGPAKFATLSLPRGVVFGPNAEMYVSDSINNRIRKFAFFEYADQPSFTLENVTSGSLSNTYSVIIASASGSVTSSVATVSLQLPPIVPAFTASNSIYNFTWSAVSNLTYQLQSATNLLAPAWIDLGSPITATNNSVSTTDAVGADEQRFYRVRLWP
jgi:sugar lactone lactonase YvrE